jgi:hypothetical protein
MALVLRESVYLRPSNIDQKKIVESRDNKP